MKKKTILFAFASKDLIRSAERLLSQASDSNFYDEINIITSDKIDETLKSKIKEISVGNKRGFGYWIWKPYFIKNKLNEINRYLDED